MKTEEMKRSFQVEIEALTTHSYTVDEAHSPEEAEEIAQTWLEEGELGEMGDRDIYNIDSYPLEDEEEEEVN